jgi:acyl transferase domain-containing protein
MTCAGSRIPVRLTAAKSRVGHAEAAAGVVGIAQAAHMLSQLQSCSLTHLRTINPLIMGPSKAAGNSTFALPRQDCAAAAAALDTATWRAMQGISSFAFQGTNAHAILCTPASGTQNLDNGQAPQPLWRKHRHWYTSAAHELLHSAGAIRSRGQAVFQTPISRPCLGKPSQHGPAQSAAGPTTCHHAHFLVT